MAIIEAYKDAEGRAEIQVFPGSLVRILLAGALDEPAGHWLGPTLTRQMHGLRGITTYWDLADLVRYHPAVRVEATAALKARLHDISAIHVHATSTIVRMGVSVANLALGGIAVTYADRNEFESRFRASRAA